ncbi:hypothetical protein BUALT_Bualt14G0037800 [Buddleja alternifolia]|uniref:Glutathione S-transferase n=1 Tax=Buddleja alternifolia TaxID=168488 RepID=A0AAV6WHW1_9LAMI|nr:hypothetical protein BUALT_Bualt14G0037800 [Buddleja alternifolia]
MRKGEEQERAKKELIEALKLLEGELGDEPYFGGNNFGFLDVAVIAYYSWFNAYEICGNFSIEEHCPILIAWPRSARKKRASPNCWLILLRFMTLLRFSRRDTVLNRYINQQSFTKL